MTSAKWTVFIVLASIAIGAAAWSYVNLFAAPPYDPEEAKAFLRHFDVRCGAEYDQELCHKTIGHHHRRCFEEHLRPGPDDALVADRAVYLECMDAARDQMAAD